MVRIHDEAFLPAPSGHGNLCAVPNDEPLRKKKSQGEGKMKLVAFRTIKRKHGEVESMSILIHLSKCFGKL